MTTTANVNSPAYNPVQDFNQTDPLARQTHVAYTPNVDPALVQWLQEADQYLQQLNSGQLPPPSQAEMAQFEMWYSWASAQVHGSGWGNHGGDPFGGGYQQDPFGGFYSPNVGAFVHNTGSATVGFLGENGLKREIYGTANINIAPHSATVTIDQVTDDRFEPNEQVIVVTVEDPFTGTETYTIHDIEELNINVPNPAMVQDNTDGSVSINVGEFQGGTMGGDFNAGISHPVQIQNGAYTIEAGYGDVIQIDATQLQNPGAVYEVYGPIDLTIGRRDQVDVYLTQEGMYEIIVTDSDGKKVTFLADPSAIQGNEKFNINGNTENIRFHDTRVGDPATPDQFDQPSQMTAPGSESPGMSYHAPGGVGVPEAFQAHFTLNQPQIPQGGGYGEDVEGGYGGGANYENTEPTRTKPNPINGYEGIAAEYNGDDISITIDPNDPQNISYHEIFPEAGATIELSHINPDAELAAMYNSETNELTIVDTNTESGTPIMVVIHLPENEEDFPRIILDANENQVGGMEEAKDMIQIGSNGDPGQAPANWPPVDELMEAAQSTLNGEHDNETLKFIRLMNNFMKTGKNEDWVKAYDAAMDAGKGGRNDVIRKFVEALSVWTGNDKAQLKDLIKMIPVGPRETMIYILNKNEASESHGSSRTNAATAALIESTLDD